MCGPYKCKDGGKQQKHPRVCFEELSAKYKFFLAFENAFCYDYVSEKLYQSLLYPWVPVVRGGANYSNILPGKMVLDASEMTPKELVEEIRRISENDTLYTEYFEWKRDLEQTIPEYRQVDTCAICNKLLKTKKSRRTPAGQSWYPSMYDWWYRDSKCVFHTGRMIGDVMPVKFPNEIL